MFLIFLLELFEVRSGHLSYINLIDGIRQSCLYSVALIFLVTDDCASRAHDYAHHWP